MNIPFLNQEDQCEHDNCSAFSTGKRLRHSQWNGENVTLRTYTPYKLVCEDCGDTVSSITRDASGEMHPMGELLESITIPVEVVEEYRNSK